MATDYGTDVYAVTDLDPAFGLVSGVTGLAQALARRLITPRGLLGDDPNYGSDLRDRLQDGLDAGGVSGVKQAVEAECAKDERVASARADVSFSSTTNTLSIKVAVEPVEGRTFVLVLAVTTVTMALLQAG